MKTIKSKILKDMLRQGGKFKRRKLFQLEYLKASAKGSEKRFEWLYLAEKYINKTHMAAKLFNSI